MEAPVQEERVTVARGGIRVMHAGRGEPVMVLHHSIGSPGWLHFHDQLAEGFSVYVPDLPGFGQSDRPEWARDPRDLAMLMNLLLDEMGLHNLSLVGCGFGGFIAAEMAVMNQNRLKSLVLVGAPGIRPERGEILDQMLISHEDYVRAGFHDEAAFERAFGSEPAPELREVWDFSREMTARVSWRPYMVDRRLPHLLRGVRVPTLLVWGEDDRIVPRSCAEQYEAVLSKARIDIVPDAGHFLDFEAPRDLARLVTAHVTFATLA